MILNGVLLWINEDQMNEFYTAAQYKSVFSDIDGMSCGEAYNRVNLQYRKLQIFDRLSLGESLTDILAENSDINAQQLLNEYKSKSYLKYTNDSFSEQILIKDVLKEIESCVMYDDYLNNINEDADKMTGISIFAEPNTFSYKNIAKTTEDFSHLKGSELKVGPSKGIAMATDFLATDLIGFILIMTIVITIVTREKELNQIVLTRTTFKGRAGLGASKLFICFSAAFISVIVLYTVNFAVSLYTYGFGDLSRQIQSVYGLNESNLKISVAEFFLFFLIAKFAVYCVFAALIYLIAVCSDTSVKVYGLLVLIIGAEAVLYYTIPSASYLCSLKFINILAYANTYNLFSVYLNLNLFGEPVNYTTVFAVSVFILTVVLSVLSISVFSKKRTIKSRAKHFDFTKIKFLKGRTTNLFLHECYKTFIGGKALLILIAFAVTVGVTYEPLKESFSSVDDVYYKLYMLEFEGEYNYKKQMMIDNEEQKFINAQAEMSKETFDSDDDTYIMMKYQKIFDSQYAFEQVKEHADYLKTTKNGEFVYDSGYKLLTGDETAGNKDLLLGLIAVSMVIFCLVYVYSIEYQTSANILLKTSAKGRTNTYFCKFVIGMIIVTLIYALTYAPYFYNVLSAYGTRGINAPACSLESLSGFNISIKSYLILICIGRYAALVLSMLIIFFLSCKLKSVISTLIASSALLILPILLAMLGIEFFKYVLLNPILIGNL